MTDSTKSGENFLDSPPTGKVVGLDWLDTHQAVVDLGGRSWSELKKRKFGWYSIESGRNSVVCG